MRVLLISPNTEQINMPTLPLGLAMVAASARRAGYEARLLDLLTPPDPTSAVCRAIGEFRPEVIALSIRNVDDQSMQDTKFLLEPVRDVVTACQAASQARIILGGAGYSIFPDDAINGPMNMERSGRNSSVVRTTATSGRPSTEWYWVTRRRRRGRIAE